VHPPADTVAFERRCITDRGVARPLRTIRYAALLAALRSARSDALGAGRAHRREH